jgi:hypothetical protein
MSTRSSNSRPSSRKPSKTSSFLTPIGYLLSENLKYVRPGRHVEVSLDLYPGQIFTGEVDSIWLGS